jgi:stage V sporulation protein R
MFNLYNYSVKDLEQWSERIEEVATNLGIKFYPQEFEIIDYRTMLEMSTYAGMLSFYPHWSSGKRYEVKSTFYQLGLEYLPYELVIASNPCLAYLMNTNDLAMQILTMAHVYGHNNFSRINKYFREFVKPNFVLDFFKSSAERIRSYENNPSIGYQGVRRCIDAAHSLRWQCVHFDLLSFLRDNSPRNLKDWEKDIINITITTFNYIFRPHMLTIGMNEGWATYCHYRIINNLRLPLELRGVCARHHSKVVRIPDNPLSYNHYLINFAIWNEIEEKFSGSSKKIPREMFNIVKLYDDVSFLKEFLTEKVVYEVGLFSYSERMGNLIVEGKNFFNIKNRLIETVRNSGPDGIPFIAVVGVDDKNNKQLHLRHNFNFRHLEPVNTYRTLEYIYYFWGHPILLETKTYRRHLPYFYEYDGIRHRQYRKK